MCLNGVSRDEGGYFRTVDSRTCQGEQGASPCKETEGWGQGRVLMELKKQVKMGLKQTGKGQRAMENGTKRFKEKEEI